jgi:phosphatidylglycerol:prolipoprotein diacylglycerol transferase
MHPILIRIPLPDWAIPLFPALLVLAVLAVLLAVYGWRKRLADLLIVGAVVAIGGIAAAFGYRGQSYALVDLPLYSYGAMLCLSLVVGWYVTLGLATRDGLPRETMANCYFVTALAALVGARLLYVVTNLHEFDSIADVLALRRGGLVAYGGFIGGLVGSVSFLRSKRLPLLPWADVAVPSLAIGLFFTRIGCYLFGCDFGQPLSDTAPAWLKALGTFPLWDDSLGLGSMSGAPAWAQHVAEGKLQASATASLPVHPTQLYESLVGLVLLGVVLLARRRQKFEGEVFLTFTFGYGLLRFGLETLRDDLERGSFGPVLPERWWVAVGLTIFAAAFWFGPSRSMGDQTLRWVSRAFFALVTLVTLGGTALGVFGEPRGVALSTSQWLALLSAVAVALVWGRFGGMAEESSEAGPGFEMNKDDNSEHNAVRAVRAQRRARRTTARATPVAKRQEREGPPEGASVLGAEPTDKKPEPV